MTGKNVGNKNTKSNGKIPQIGHIFRAMFLLEEMREIYRHSVPIRGFSDKEWHAFNALLEDLKIVIEDLSSGKHNMDFSGINIGMLPLRVREEEYINIGPIQAAGRLTPEARKALISYGDGYSTCDYCRKPFRLDKIKKPDIQGFHEELADWLNMDTARVVPGARRGFQAVISSVIEKGDIVLVSALAHYTEFLAVEQAGGIIREIPLNENNIVSAENTAKKIETIKENEGRIPKLIVIDYYDYMLGNEHEVYSIGDVSEDYGIPYLVNCAYAMGVRPIDGKKMKADFLVGSGHKSMASPAPTGVLAINEKWQDKVLRTTVMEGDITGRKFGIKEVELLGCTVMGAPLLGMMASFPKVKERVKHWDEEVKKSNYFIERFLEIPGNNVVSELPRRHTLSKVDTTNSYDTIARHHKRRGYFLSEELKARGIIGVFEGATKMWKLNTYGLEWEQIKYLADCFQDIAMKYGLI